MPNRTHYARVAKELRTKLDEDRMAFKTVSRREILDVLRDISGEPTTRIKSVVARDLAQVMLEREALRCFPSLEETDSLDNVRIFRAASVFGNLVDLIAHPSKEDDKEAGDILKKIKLTWVSSAMPETDEVPVA
jgi:hypothetical protein